MYQKIIVPLDGSKLAEQVLPYVRLLAGAHGVRVELLQITDPDTRPPHGPATREYLQQAAARGLRAAAKFECIEKTGKPADVIVEQARGDDTCLIAMATHGTSGMRRWLLGSVASKVVQTARNPLLLIRPNENADPAAAIDLNTIFVPLDGSGLAEKALPHAVDLAKRLKLAVQLLRVYSLPGDAYVVAEGVISQGAGQFKEVMQKEAESYLEGKVETLRAEGLENVIGTAMEGDAASEIVDLAAKTAKSLIAMSTHGRSGIGRWLLGSVADKVLQHSHVPVLLIRAG